jgi:hypothetical protein
MTPKTKLTPPQPEIIETQAGLWKGGLVVLLGQEVVCETRQVKIAQVQPFPGRVGCYEVMEPIITVNEVAVLWQSEPIKIVVVEESE